LRNSLQPRKTPSNSKEQQATTNTNTTQIEKPSHHTTA
jgi:hypothetical protein